MVASLICFVGIASDASVIGKSLKPEAVMKDCATYDTIQPFDTDVREAASRVDNLDAGPLLEVLTREQPDGLGWARKRAIVAVGEYKKFLKLNVLYRTERIVPNRMVDEVWHTHILDTRKYAVDCENLLGFFLHHFPYFGQRGDADQRDSSFDVTQALYEREFGLSPIASKVVAPAGCDAGDIKAAGCDAGDVRPAGCDAGDIKAAGCDAGDVRPAGCDAGDIKSAINIV